jgi:eukaryotic-like serine/threonine-protein kinase
MPLSVGDKLGTYEILAPIGAGGMGEVYRARDTKLERDVAIKVLPAALAQDPERLARFEREAKVLASLNHPNIAQIYGVEDRALVMELVVGETLQGPLPLETALGYARQIADALEAAHEKGIIHRDLKPANMMITPAGVVKVLDFGLAALPNRDREGADSVNSPTLTISPTRAGMILGTAGYMSPEQARGKAVDKRADIWAFGVVLFEMLTGKPLFAGETVSDTLAAVLKEEPDWTRVPVKVRRLLQACLQKDPQQRLQAIGDWKLLLDEREPIAAPPPRSRFGMILAAVAAAFALIAAALAFVHFREKPAVKELVRFEISAPANATLGSTFAVSPDGRKIAFIATGADRKPMLWVRSLDSEEARPLTGTEDAGDPFWSPDSRFLAFQSGTKLKRIEAEGGPAQTLCDAPTFTGGAWTSDNRILIGTLGPLQVVSASGGTPTPLTALDHSRNEIAHEVPAMLPDGHHFLYFRLSIPLENGGAYVGSLDAKPEQQSTKRLLAATPAVYVPSPLVGDAPGFLLFVRDLALSPSAGSTFTAQPFDPKRLELSGEAVPIAEQVTSASASPSVLAFQRAGTQGSTQLTWYDRKGNVLSTAGEPGEYQSLALSPDQTRVVYQRGNDLWLFEFTRGVNTKFTFGNLSESPAWFADGSRIAFMSIRGSGTGIYQKASNLAGQEELLYQSPELKGYAPDWTHDGKFLMYNALSSDGKQGDLWILPVGGSAADRKPLSFLRTEFEEGGGRFSPDDRWVAYESNQSGKTEIYVLPFDESNPGSPTGGLHQVSKDGGVGVRWSGDGKELFYLAPDGYLMSVDVSAAGGAFQTGAPHQLFKSPAGYGSWDVSADGKRFLTAAPPASGSAGPASRPYHVVVNWTELLKR